MCNKRIAILLFLILTHGVQAACLPLMKRLIKKGPFANTQEYQLRKKIANIERTTNFFRRKKENTDPALNLRAWKKISVMHENILNGTHAPNERRWRTFFREFEANYISFKRSKELVNIINEDQVTDFPTFFARLTQQGYPNSYIDFIRRQAEELESLENLKIALDLEGKNTVVRLGSNYQEYRMVRGSLEDLLEKPECNETCQRMTQQLLSNLGAESDKNQMIFKVFFEGETTPSIKEMRELLYQENLFVLTKLKKERNVEILRFLTSFATQPQFIDALFGYIYKSEILGKKQAVKLFKMIYNAQARNFYFPKVNRVVYGPKSPQQALDALQNLNTSVEGDELLVTFARRVDTLAQGKWKNIKEQAKNTEPDFHKRMISAEEKAKARGDLSPTQESSFVARLATLVVIGVPAIGYFYFDALPTSVQEILYTSDEEAGETGSQGGPVSQQIDPVQPVPGEGENIAIEGEKDQVFEEVIDVLQSEEEGSKRNPSSHKSARPLFTRMWCSLFHCRGY